MGVFVLLLIIAGIIFWSGSRSGNAGMPASRKPDDGSDGEPLDIIEMDDLRRHWEGRDRFPRP